MSEKDPSDARTTQVKRPGSSAMFTKTPATEAIPERIGPYRVLHLIEEAGMGAVFLAVREEGEPRQRVAIKLIRQAVRDESVVARFEQEWRILNALDHPNIVRFIERDFTADGRPYYAMEYIEGLPLDEYCDSNNLSVKDRLELFIKICSAVHYAHTNLIVHRDLKPTNILVTPKGEPKLIDFGIAKLLNPNLAGAAVVTGPMDVLLTPEYASPEQVQGHPISTLSDVYSLGVLLYELLTGIRPLALRTRVQAEVVNIICNTMPERPSTRLSHLDETPKEPTKKRKTTTLAEIAKHRGTHPTTLRRQLSGEIDDIIMMALSKAPMNRYASAQVLAEDVANHLAGRPVQARRVRRRAIYLMRKYAHRHPALVGSSVAAVLALIVGGSLATWQWRAAVAARNEASEQRDIATAVVDRLVGYTSKVITDVNSKVKQLPGSLEARESLLDLTESLTKELPEIVDTRATQLLLATTYEELGANAADIRSGNRGDLSVALQNQRFAQAIRERIHADGPADPQVTEQLATSAMRIADLAVLASDYPAATELYERAIELLEPLDGDERSQLIPRAKLFSAITGLARIDLAFGRYDQARPRIDRANELRLASMRTNRSLGTRRNVTVGQRDLAELQLELGQFEEASDNIALAIGSIRDIVSERPEASRYRRNLVLGLVQQSGTLLASGAANRALESAREASGIIEALLAQERGDSDTPDVRHLEARLRVLLALGDATFALGQADSAAAHFQSAADAARELLTLSPDRTVFTDLLIEALLGTGAVALARDDAGADGIGALEEARILADSRLAEESGVVPVRRRLVRGLILIGDWHAGAARRAVDANERRLESRRALDAYQQARALAAEFPSDRTVGWQLRPMLDGLDRSIRQLESR